MNASGHQGFEVEMKTRILINDGSTRTFEWDGANRLVAVNYTGTNNRREFGYDGLSRLAKIVERTVKERRPHASCRSHFDANGSRRVVEPHGCDKLARVNRLYFGDNLEWLRDRREFPDASVDFVYLDPPFSESID